MALVRINNTSLPVKPGFSALSPACAPCSRVCPVAHRRWLWDFPGCVSPRIGICFASEALCCRASLLCVWHSEVSSLRNDRNACVAKTATSIHEENLQVFIYRLRFVFRNVGFVLACGFFPFECTVERVAKCHCLALF